MLTGIETKIIDLLNPIDSIPRSKLEKVFKKLSQDLKSEETDNEYSSLRDYHDSSWAWDYTDEDNNKRIVVRGSKSKLNAIETFFTNKVLTDFDKDRYMEETDDGGDSEDETEMGYLVKAVYFSGEHLIQSDKEILNPYLRDIEVRGDATVEVINSVTRAFDSSFIIAHAENGGVVHLHGDDTGIHIKHDKRCAENLQDFEYDIPLAVNIHGSAKIFLDVLDDIRYVNRAGLEKCEVYRWVDTELAGDYVPEFRIKMRPRQVENKLYKLEHSYYEKIKII